MTIETLLGYTAVFDAELVIESDGSDEVRTIRALNIVQKWFEAIASGESEAFQSYGTVYQTANTEVTSWPTGLLRLDDLWYVDTTTTPNLPAWRLEPIYETGGHRPSVLGANVDTLGLSITTGKPMRYWATQPPNGKIFWERIPDATNTVRYYGLIAATDYSARTDTFSYPDSCAPVFAQQAAKILRMGRDDSIEDLRIEAAGSLATALRGSRRWWSTGPVGRHYEYTHDT
jgi:hypothetical protein